MNKIQARRIVHRFCKFMHNDCHSKEVFLDVCKDFNKEFYKNDRLVEMTSNWFEYFDEEIKEAIDMVPEVVEHVAAWTYGGGRFGEK